MIHTTTIHNVKGYIKFLVPSIFRQRKLKKRFIPQFFLNVLDSRTLPTNTLFYLINNNVQCHFCKVNLYITYMKIIFNTEVLHIFGNLKILIIWF